MSPVWIWEPCYYRIICCKALYTKWMFPMMILTPSMPTVYLSISQWCQTSFHWIAESEHKSPHSELNFNVNFSLGKLVCIDKNLNKTSKRNTMQRRLCTAFLNIVCTKKSTLAWSIFQKCYLSQGEIATKEKCSFCPSSKSTVKPLVNLVHITPLIDMIRKIWF